MSFIKKIFETHKQGDMTKKKDTQKRAYQLPGAEVGGGTGIDFNDEFKAAFTEMEGTQNHVYITGKAGTGKSRKK